MTEKEELELRKLRAEAKHLELPLWKKPAYIGLLASILVALTTLTVGIATKLIELEVLDLLEQKGQLELDIEESNSNLESMADSLEAVAERVAIYQGVLESRETELDLLVDSLSSQQNTIDNQTDSLVNLSQAKAVVTALRVQNAELRHANITLELGIHTAQGQQELATAKCAFCKRQIEWLQDMEVGHQAIMYELIFDRRKRQELLQLMDMYDAMVSKKQEMLRASEAKRHGMEAEYDSLYQLYYDYYESIRKPSPSF